MGESQDRVTELKVIPLDAKEFEANGKTYRRSRTISPSRWADMQRLEIELSFGTTLAAHSKGLQTIYQLLNKQAFADAAVETKNLILGIASLDEKRIPTALKMCCLFLNYDGEDVRSIDEKTIAEKINDFERGGIDVMSLFQLALSAIPDYLSAYKNAFPSSSSLPETPSESTTNTASEG